MARYIDADLLIKNIAKIEDLRTLSTKTIGEAISNTPTADVEEVKHGTWLPQIVNGIKSWDCSECKTLGSPHWKRCPICEAKMDGGKTE